MKFDQIVIKVAISYKYNSHDLNKPSSICFHILDTEESKTEHAMK